MHILYTCLDDTCLDGTYSMCQTSHVSLFFVNRLRKKYDLIIENFHALLFTLNFGACSLSYKLSMEMYLNGLFGLSPRRRTEGAS